MGSVIYGTISLTQCLSRGLLIYETWLREGVISGPKSRGASLGTTP